MPREQDEEFMAWASELREFNRDYFWKNESSIRHVYENQCILVYTNSGGLQVICAAPNVDNLRRTISLLEGIQKHSAYLAIPKKSH